jgi:hypothetical protein
MRFENWISTIPLRLRSLFRRRAVEQELDEELQFHLDQQIALHSEKGLTPDEARYAALRALGMRQRRKSRPGTPGRGATAVCSAKTCDTPRVASGGVRDSRPRL